MNAASTARVVRGESLAHLAPGRRTTRRTPATLRSWGGPQPRPALQGPRTLPRPASRSPRLAHGLHADQIPLRSGRGRELKAEVRRAREHLLLAQRNRKRRAGSERLRLRCARVACDGDVDVDRLCRLAVELGNDDLEAMSLRQPSLRRRRLRREQRSAPGVAPNLEPVIVRRLAFDQGAWRRP